MRMDVDRFLNHVNDLYLKRRQTGIYISNCPDEVGYLAEKFGAVKSFVEVMDYFKGKVSELGAVQELTQAICRTIWAKRNGVDSFEQDYTPCIILRHKHKGYNHLCKFGGIGHVDHGYLSWKRGDKRASEVWFHQPYVQDCSVKGWPISPELCEQYISRAREWVDQVNVSSSAKLIMTASTDESWHVPGSTILIAIRRAL